MPSVAERVFAISELLENILLNLSWRNLFKLQRTCKVVRGTISTSLKLQKTMHLIHKTEAEEAKAANPSVLEELLIKDLYLGTFVKLANDNPNLVNFKLRLELPSDSSINVEPLGMRIEDPATMDSQPSSSWRKMKLLHARRAVEVRVFLHHKPCRLASMSDLRFDAGEDSVGELVDKLINLRVRSIRGHRHCCVCSRSSLATRGND